MAALCGEGDALGKLPVDVGHVESRAREALSCPAFAPIAPLPTHDGDGIEAGQPWPPQPCDLASTPGMRILVVVNDSIRYDGTHGQLGRRCGNAGSEAPCVRPGFDHQSGHLDAIDHDVG